MKSPHSQLTTSQEHGESFEAPSSSEEGVGGGGITRQTLLKRAAEMRRNLPEPERRIWMALRDRRFVGFKFRRQAVIGSRIVDFFCPAKGLVVEIDGETHDAITDAARDRQFERSFGFKVIRFANPDVMQNIDGVLHALEIALERQPDRWLNRSGHHPPTPSSEEEGE